MPAPRLILFTPTLEAASIAICAARLAVAAAKADVACVVTAYVRDVAEATMAPLFRFAAEHDIALLATGATTQAAQQGFDGLHVNTGETAIAETVPILKPDKIIGVGGLSTRDEAMMAGEAGADYVMFGEDGDARQALALIAWWAEVMEPPCAGFATTLADVSTFAAAGADFIALPPSLWYDREEAIVDARAALEAQS